MKTPVITTEILTTDDDRADNRRVVSLMDEYDCAEVGTIQREKDYVGGLEDRNDQVVWRFRPAKPFVRWVESVLSVPPPSTFRGTYAECFTAAQRVAELLVRELDHGYVPE